MKQLKIETYHYQTGNLVNSVSLPVSIAKTFIKCLPPKLAHYFSEHNDNLATLSAALNSRNSSGVLLEIEDLDNNERVIFSITGSPLRAEVLQQFNS